VLGHQSLQMTMRYAHLLPTHLEEVRTLNRSCQLVTLCWQFMKVPLPKSSKCINQAGIRREADLRTA
jgi:hypothetical protein